MHPLETPLLIALWSLAGLVVTAMCLPPLLALCGCTRFTTECDEDPARLEPDGHDESYADAHRKLTALGFVPLGVYWEKAWFLAHHWFKSFEVKSFACRGRRCFGQIYRMLPGDTVRVFFATCFEDGTYVCTANHMEEFVINRAGYYRWGVETADLAVVLEHHEAMAARLGAGRTAKAPDNLRVLTDTLTPHNDAYLRADRAGPLNNLGAVLVEPGMAAVLAVSCFGPAHWLVPAAVLVGCARRAVFQAHFLWQLARERNRRVAAERETLGS
jgi:hypothetical protein